MVDMNYLKNKNPMEMFDPFISFDEKEHFYFINSDTYKVSVTGFIDSFFPGFDANKTIMNMKKSKNWKTDPKYKQYQGLTNEQIKEKWNANGLEASTNGTAFHESVEKYYNHPTLWCTGGSYEYFQKIFDSVTLNKVPFQQFLNWHHDHIIKAKSNWIPFRTELRVFDLDYRLAGSIDMIYYLNENANANENVNANENTNQSKKLIIIDWKNSKKITLKNQYEKAKKPIDHLSNCNFSKYSLQLNMYKHIIEKNTKHQVIFMALAVFHETHQSYEFYPVSVMTDDIHLILSILKTKTMEDIYNEIQIKKNANK